MDHLPGASRLDICLGESPLMAFASAAGVRFRTSIGLRSPRRSRIADVYALACSLDPEAGFVNTDIVIQNSRGGLRIAGWLSRANRRRKGLTTFHRGSVGKWRIRRMSVFNC